MFKNLMESDIDVEIINAELPNPLDKVAYLNIREFL